MKRWAMNCLGVLLLCWGLAANALEPRIALVIGNTAYGAKPLRNPANDARAVAATLRRLGFEVILRENAKLVELLDAFAGFVTRSRPYPVRLVYFAGHGVQMKGRNFLLPIDADIRYEDEVRYKGADVGELLDRLAERRSGLNIIILDACRNNPYPADLRAVGAGLANMEVPALSLSQRVKIRGTAQGETPQGTLVAYATAPGAVAYDGEVSNSLYTGALLSHIETPGLPLELLFKRVRQAVSRQTHEAQIPWENSSLVGDFCFVSTPDGKCSPEIISSGKVP